MALLDFNQFLPTIGDSSAPGMSSLKRSVSSMENLQSWCQSGMKRVSRCYNLSQMDQTDGDDETEDTSLQTMVYDLDDDMMYDSGFDIESDTIASPEAGSQFPGRPPCSLRTKTAMSGCAGGTHTPAVSSLKVAKPPLTNRHSLGVLPERGIPANVSFLHTAKGSASTSDKLGGGLSQLFSDNINITDLSSPEGFF